MESCLCTFSDAAWRPQGAWGCLIDSSWTWHSSLEDAITSPALFLRTFLESTESLGLPAGLFLLCQHSNSEDAGPSPAFLFSTCIKDLRAIYWTPLVPAQQFWGHQIQSCFLLQTAYRLQGLRARLHMLSLHSNSEDPIPVPASSWGLT